MDNFQTNRRYALNPDIVAAVLQQRCTGDLEQSFMFHAIDYCEREGISVFASIVDFNRFCLTSLR